MDVHSSSLLSPIAPAPNELAEERSALSQVYSDSHSIDPDLVSQVNPDPSSLQPLRSPHTDTQDTTPITDESILIAKIVDDLKVMIQMRAKELDAYKDPGDITHRQIITW